MSAPRVFVFGLFAQHFLSAVEPGEGFGDLRADADHLEHGRDQEGHEGGEHHEAAEGERVRAMICRAPTYITMAPTKPISTVAERLISEMAVRLRMHVIEQALDAAGEYASLLGLGVIALDDAHAGQRFGEAAGDFGSDLAALAENGADVAECPAQAEPETLR